MLNQKRMTCELQLSNNPRLAFEYRSIKSFKWIEDLSFGTFGFVYKAEDLITGEHVAIKKIKLDEKRKRLPDLLSEIKFLSSCVHHPSIVQLKAVAVGDYCENSKRYELFIVMEYLPEDLRSLLEKSPSMFNEDRVREVMHQLLTGIAHLHHNGILHADIKTNNILVDKNGIIKLCDFGLAERFPDVNRYFPPRASYRGTLPYCPPEMLLGAEYSTALDIWSAGCVMAEMLHKRRLFRGRTVTDMLNQIFTLLGTPAKEVMVKSTWSLEKKMQLPVVVKPSHHKLLREKIPPSSLSSDGFDLLCRLLDTDPENRITAEEALSHTWFSEDDKVVNTKCRWGFGWTTLFWIIWLALAIIFLFYILF